MRESEPERESWPHTDTVVRRQVTDETMTPREVAQIKRERQGLRARGAILSQPAADRTPVRHLKDPRRSPILDCLEDGPATAPTIAERLERDPGSTGARLRQLGAGGFVRRTGRMLPGGRGGPRVEYALCDPAKTPTDVRTTLRLAPRPDDDCLRTAYFEHLLALADNQAPQHVFDRIERLLEASDDNVVHVDDSRVEAVP
jgi:hypothetical protein